MKTIKKIKNKLAELSFIALLITMAVAIFYTPIAKSREVIKCAYTYNAKVVSVYDGDTITVDIDLGLKTFIKGEKIRLFGINAPEVRGESRAMGIISRDWLRAKILGKNIILKTIKDKKGKYGRYIGDIYIDGVNINTEIVSQGFAVTAKY